MAMRKPFFRSCATRAAMSGTWSREARSVTSRTTRSARLESGAAAS